MSQTKKPQKKSLLSTIGLIVVAVLLLVGQQLGLLPAAQETAEPTVAITEAAARETAQPAAEAVEPAATEAAKTTSSGTGQATVITEPQAIVNYLAAHNGELPDNFITKSEAQALGWDSSKNYVSDVAPGKSIGGDRFGNYEGLLPKASGRQYHEADCYYSQGARNACRLVYSTDGLYFYTEDHYESFEEMHPEQ